MKEVHELGKSILWTGEREQAESYVYQRGGDQAVLKRMIDFQIKVDPRILQAIFLKLRRCLPVHLNQEV